METLDLSYPYLPKPAVLTTLIKVTGSHPQEVGAKMWVTEDKFYGTLGGGEFELRVLKYSRELLKALGPSKPHIKEYILCKETNQCCGGRAEVFFEIVANKKRIHLFGGGHVGRAMAQVLSGMPYQVALIDPRSEWVTPEGAPSDIKAHCGDSLAYAQNHSWNQDDAVCIFTHSHDLDFQLVKYFLRQPIGYLGLIGSDHKAQVFEARLKASDETGGARALFELWEEKMHCPMGTPLPSKNPKVIAVSIVTELLKEWALKERDPTTCLSDQRADP